ncbi:fumarate hydratase C-terminal domain-containing protein [Roseovarius ramblicola]|uniref:Fumarate hydratase C-terminal domain-containing protein n=1 Tax=Roseovarius ramblicola TaxID=2022336 RepID=A0ABV5I315_9RHOB
MSVMIGKAERKDATIDTIARTGAACLIAVGGAACLVSQAVREARVLPFDDLGMEAIHEFGGQDMPVTVAVDSRGGSVQRDGPKTWRRAGSFYAQEPESA